MTNYERWVDQYKGSWAMQELETVRYLSDAEGEETKSLYSTFKNKIEALLADLSAGTNVFVKTWVVTNDTKKRECPQAISISLREFSRLLVIMKSDNIHGKVEMKRRKNGRTDEYGVYVTVNADISSYMMSNVLKENGYSF